MTANQNPLKIMALMALALSVACVCGVGAASADESFDQSYPLSAGGAFQLDNVNGAVTVVAWDRPEVHVKAYKKARAMTEEKAREGLGKLEIAVTATPDLVKIDTKYPKRAHGDWFGQGCSLSVEYQVEVPRGAQVSVDTVNGAVTVNAPGSKVSCQTVNGAVHAEGALSLRAETVNGKIAFQVASVESVETTNGSIEGKILGPQSSEGRVETVNGGIHLSLASSLSVVVDGENVNGSVRCDLDGFSAHKHHISGVLGSGGPTISLETVNGSLEVSKHQQEPPSGQPGSELEKSKT